MRCAAIMTVDPLTLRDTMSVAEAVRILVAHRHLSVPVVDRDGHYVGMFGTDDLLNLVVPRVALAGNLASNLRFIDNDPKILGARFQALKDRPVREVADPNSVVLAPDTPQVEAFRIFCRNHASLPVVEPGSRKLLGVVSYWDVLGAVTAAA